jgi:receptor tyrosine kinase-like orphan receptor 1
LGKINGTNNPLEMNALLATNGGTLGTIGRTSITASSTHSHQQVTKLRAPEIPLASVRFLQELGEGSFGKVYKGEILSPDGKSVTPVAIKSLKPDASQKVVADFRREADLMVDLHHPNIVCLLGIASKSPGSTQLQAMFFEYMTQVRLTQPDIFKQSSTAINLLFNREICTNF